ncbi:Retrovirus-related Pol polyprotein from transposon RE2 (Retro element 2) (AtRE2) [Includes: Protease RE2 [Durusdinium trenchii]|uniref:Retrovirus-related Pol polyprotein from transposon RE2 (Retro element 2) (AtRE2) n=1 Tax=Durusdinium trenchii TaxID=1381693 RepID=A0ABP0SHJ5_9DINO
MIVGQTHGGIIGGSAGTVVHHYVDGSSAGGIVGGDIGTGGTVVHHYVDGSSAGGIVGGDIGTGGTVVHHYVDGSSGSGIVGGGHYVGSSIGGVIPATHYVGGTSSVGGIMHGGVQDHVHVTHYTVPAPVPQPVTPQVKVKQVVQNHYGTVYRKVPVNHYVHVKTPEQPPIVHTVKVMTPAKTYSCDGVGDQADPTWSDKHTRWCCYKYGTFCPKTVVDKNIYHTVVKTQPVRVPVPEPMPTHAPIVKTIRHTYHVPSPPQYVHVPVPGPTVVKPVVVPESVPVPVPQPPQVINVKKPYTVHVPGPNHYVHVPVPSPPHIVTKYHTKWNTVVDHAHTMTYNCDTGVDDWHSLWTHAKQRWCCSHKFVGCPGSVSTGLDSVGSTLAGDSLASSFGSDYGSLGSSSLTSGASDSDLSASTLSSGALSSSDFSSDLSGSTLSSGALSSSGFSSGLSYEVDPEAVRTEERMGSYSQVSNMEMATGADSANGANVLPLANEEDQLHLDLDQTQGSSRQRGAAQSGNIKENHLVPVPIPPPPRKVITHPGGRGRGRLEAHLVDETAALLPHYHTITKTEPVNVPVPVPVPAPPAQVITHVKNVPIHDPWTKEDENPPFLRPYSKLYDGADETVGPLIAGRLVGRAQTIALQLRLPDPHGNVDVGDAALVRLAVDEVRDPMNPNIILQQHIPSGVSALCRALRDAFGEADQLQVTKSLEEFFDCRRGRLSLQEFSVEWSMKLDQAILHAGLQLNAVARTFLFFRAAQLPQKHVDDIMMQLQGDMNRFDEARALALRLAHRQPEGVSSHYEAADYYGIEDEYEQSWHTGVSTYWDEYHDADDGYTTDWKDYDSGWSQYAFEAEEFYDPELYYDEEAWYDESWNEEPETTEEAAHVDDENFYQGRGKGYGRKGYWTSGESSPQRRQEQQLRHAREGLQLNLMSSSSQAVNPPTAVTSPSMTSDEPDLLRLPRPVRLSTPPDGTSGGGAEAKSASSVKHLNFPVQVNQSSETDTINSYHLIHGIKRRGLLVDPGAAAGLIGSETLRDLICECLTPQGLQDQIQWRERTTSVTGISGKGDETMAEVSFRFALGPEKTGTFTGDVLGGDGSLCPPLISNPSLRSLRAVICSSWFENGDGLLVCPSDDGKPENSTMIRLLLTDSGHYIIPMDASPSVKDTEQKKARTFLHSTFEITSQQWQDVRAQNKYCFKVDQNVNDQEDLERNEKKNDSNTLTTSMAENATMPVIQATSSTPSSTSSTMPVILATPDSSSHTTGTMPVILATTSPSSTTSSTLPVMTGKDHWKKVENQWHRIHVRPRTALFSPAHGKFPDILDNIYEKRETHVHYVNGEDDTILDTWQVPEAQQPLRQKWTGVTIFEIKQKEQTCDVGEIYIGDREDHNFAEDELAAYEKDTFPEHITEEKRKYLEKFYKAVPEEFYTKLKRKPEHPKSKESKEEQKKTDLRENFRQEALSSKNVNEGTLATIPEIGLTTEQTSLLKYSLMKILQYSMEEFDDPESKNPDYMHWVTDPVVLSWTRSIFENHLKIAGICALIKPWTKPTPTPKLRPDSAFLRLMIRGTIAQWRMMPIEDLRDLSHSQCHEPVDFDEDWLICFFGVYPSLPSRPKAAVPSTPSGAPDTPAAAPHTPAGAPKTPAMAPGTPAAPEAEPIVPLPEETQEELLPQPYEEARIEPVQPGDQPTALKHLTLKRILHQALDNVCHIYFYFYTMYGEEPMQRPAPVTTRQMPEQSMPHPMNEDGDVEVGDNLKRDAPDSRTIIMAPEKKKQRIHFSITEQQLLMQSVHWMLRRPLQVQYESPEVLLQEDTFYNYTLEDSTDTVQKKSIKPGYLFHFSSKTTMTLRVDLRTQEVLKVDTETDVLTEAQLIAHWPLFEKADADEIAQFAHEDAFEKLHISQVSDDMVVVDCTWVRKFKRNPDGSKKAKSRLCARGFMDAQKAALPTRSTTATRLSQRILVSMAAALGLQVESLDVSGAFLKGLSFHQVRKLLNEKGHNCPQRTVIVIPPANVWRHLAAVNPKFNVSEEKMSDWVLLAKKPIYGLVDAPLAWQLCLHQFIEANGGLPSYFDENMFMWKNEQGKITALMTTHVDDLAIASDSQQLDKFHSDFQKQFGKVSRQVMPFQHCGCRYTSVPCGIRIDQEEFTENLKIVDAQKSSDEERTLTPEEVTQYRSQLGALLWLTATRLDLISDVFDDIDEGKLMTPDRELLSAFAYAAWTIKPNAGFAFLCLSALLTQATATTVGDTKEESDYGAFKMLIIFTSVIAIVLWIAMKHMVEKMLSAFNKREAEQSCERPAHFETSEQKTQTETSFQEHPQNVTELEEHLARQRDENQKLREENKNLQVQVTRWQKRVDMLSDRIAELNQWPQDDETRILKVPRYVHQKHYVPAPEPSPPQYRNVPAPMPVKEPGKVIKVPTPLPPQTVVRNKVNSGWSSAKKSWCCAHEQKGCPGSHSGHLTKTVVTGVTQHEGPTYYHHLGTVPYHHIHHIHHYHTYHTHSYANYDNSDGLSTDVMAPRRLQAIAAEALPSGASIAGHYVDGSDASIGQSHYIDGTGGATRVIHSSYADSADSGTASSYADGILHGGHYVDSASTGIHDGQYTDGSSSLSSLGDLVHEGHYGSSSGQILHDGWSTIHPEVHVKMPQQPPIVHTVKVMAPAKTYSCNGVGDQPDPSWSDKHTRWCCYKYGTFCPKTVIDKNIYHTVVKKQPVKVPVPEPMPTHPPIVKTIHHTYHVPSPPRYVHVPVPGPTVVKNVVVPENVPVPVPEPPQVINVKKPYTVHVPGKNHYVHVPVPSPPHIVTKYHTHWNTVVDHGDTATYDCHAGFSDWHSLWSHAKQRWCCSNKFVGCPGSWHGAIAHTTHVTHVHHIHHYHSGSYPGGWHSHSWSSSDGYHPLKK